MIRRLLTLLLLSPLAFADYEEMISLKDYIAENSMEDLSVLFYVTTRCSGLFSVAASLSAPESENHQRFLTTAEKFYAVSINVREAIDPDTESKEHEDKTFKTVSAIAARYTNSANKHYVDKGTYFTELMFDDTELCGQLNR
jgi:hypothetical protein